MNKLAYWRAKRGLTIRELAEKTKINPASISRIEKGHVKPYLSTLGKLATALDIDLKELSELVEDSQEPEPNAPEQSLLLVGEETSEPELPIAA